MWPFVDCPNDLGNDMNFILRIKRSVVYKCDLESIALLFLRNKKGGKSRQF